MTEAVAPATPSRPPATARLVSDSRLARRAAKGDRKALSAIYQRYHHSLYRYCFSIVGNADDAQDALQNTMVKVMRALPGERRQIQLKPWLYRIAHNESVGLLRKRREEPQIDPELVASSGRPEETAASRERLRRLLADLADLPERQRASLIMRELAGLSFDEIGATFDTSASVARQAVYEARLNLRRLEEGREMSCAEVMRQISDADGRVMRRRDIQAHLRACPDCRGFRDSIEGRQRDLAAIAPLPAVASAGILHGLLAGAAGDSAAGAGAAGAVGVGAGKVVASSVALKSAATVAVVAAVGVTAADRGGLVDAGLPGGSSGGAAIETRQAAPASASPDSAGNGGQAVGVGKQQAARGDGKAAGADGGSTAAGAGAAGTTGRGGPAPSEGDGKGSPATLPGASQHGQETAAAHKSGPKPKKKAKQQGKGAGRGKGSGRSQGTRSHGANSPRGSRDTAKKAGGTGAGKSPPASHGEGTKTKPSQSPPPGTVTEEPSTPTTSAPSAEADDPATSP